MRLLVSVLLAAALLASSPVIAKEKGKGPTTPAAGTAVATNLPAGGTYFAPDAETTSAGLVYHPRTGLHAVFAGWENNTINYAQCVESDCTADGAWKSVALPLPQSVKAQLALTADGRPRLLGAGWSDAAANGTDYFFAQCDNDCLQARNWQIGKIMSTADGLMSNISRNRLPEHTFALDPRGNPRFFVADSNYHVEPDHYGGFFMSCDRNCTQATSWTETNLANQFGYSTESFNGSVLSIAADGSAHVLANVYAFESDGNDVEDGLFYYSCQSRCETRANWSRSRLLHPGTGVYPNPTWSMDTMPDGRPRVALFTGFDNSVQNWDRQLLYLWCEKDCTAADGLNWYGYPIGVGNEVGESPNIRMASNGQPHIAFTTDGYDLGYATCARDCENENGAPWDARIAEASEVAAQDRPTAIPFTCDGEVWQGMAPQLALVADHPIIAYDLSVEARCLYKEMGKPEITYEFHEIWRGGRVVRP